MRLAARAVWAERGAVPELLHVSITITRITITIIIIITITIIIIITIISSNNN